MSERAASESFGPRAEWQRGMAAYFLDKIVRESLPEAIALTYDTTIESQLELATRQSSPQANAIIKASLVMDPLLEYYRNVTLEQLIDPRSAKALQPGFIEYTYQSSIRDVAREGMNTELCFPVNLLAVADSKRPSHLPPVFTSLRDIAAIYRSPWFRKVITLAASGANGSWEDISFNPAHRIYPRVTELNRQAYYMRFDYHITNLGTTFEFSSDAKEALQKARETKNAQALAQNYSHETWSEGSSSGCPVYRTKPLFKDPDDVTLLAAIYGITPEEVMKSHTESAISFGLLQLAGLLERAAAIDESKHQRARTEKVAPTSGQLALEAAF